MARMRIGLYGCGCRTRQILSRALQDGMAEVVLCHDCDASKASATAEYYGGRACGLEELLTSQSIDMYLISLFPAAHPDALLRTAQSGKPIYIEKPVAVSQEDLLRLLPLAATDQFIHVGLSYRYIPIFRTLQDLVARGRIGDLIGIHATWLAHPQLPAYEPGTTLNWRYLPETGGELTQHCCHTFEWFRTLGGEFDSIMAMSSQREDNQSCIEDLWDMVIKQRTGCQVSFHLSMRNDKFSMLGYLEGAEGTLEWEWNDPSRVCFFKSAHVRNAGTIISVPDTVPDALEEFIRRYQQGEAPAVSLSDGLWSILPPILARKSACNGQLCRFPRSLNELSSNH